MERKSTTVVIIVVVVVQECSEKEKDPKDTWPEQWLQARQTDFTHAGTCTDYYDRSVAYVV